MARYRDDEEDLDTAPVDENGMPDSTQSKAALLKDARLNPKESFTKDNIPEGYMVSGMRTLEFRDANDNGIEDRGEGIYLGRDLEPKPSNYGVPPTGGMSGPTGAAGAAGAAGKAYAATSSLFQAINNAGSSGGAGASGNEPYPFDESYFNAGVENNKAAAPPAAAPPAAAAVAAPAQNFFDYLPDKDERGFSALPKAETRDQATERVSYFEQTGQDMKAFVARQDPMFKDAFADQARTGKSTSSLRLLPQPSEGSARREANNYEREANKSGTPPAVRNALMAKAAMIRAGQPSISSPLSRKQEMERGMQKRDVLQGALEMGQQAAGVGGDVGGAGVKGEAGAKEPTLGTSDGKGLTNGLRLGTTAKGGVGASAPLGGGRKTEDKKKTGALAYQDDDKLLGMSGGTSTYQYTRLAPLQIMLQDLKSRRA